LCHYSFFLSLLVLVAAAAASFGGGGSRQVTALAEGVYAIQHRNSPDGNPSGNTTVIIGDRQVFVVPAFARSASLDSNHSDDAKGSVD
jgi:hypothetical protein